MELTMTHLSVLTPEDVEALHQASLRILAETGVILKHPEGRALILDAGGKLRTGAAEAAGGARDDRLLIPPELVEDCIHKAGKQTCVRGRSGKTKTLGD